MTGADGGSWGEPSAFGPSGAPFNACGIHQDEPATFTCSRCGTFGCPTCLGAEKPMPLCYTCAERGENAVPWERRDRIGLFAAIKDTTSMALFRPSEFFSRPAAEGFTGPAMYGLVAYTIGMASFAVAIFVIYAGMGLFLGGIADQPGLGAMGGIGMGAAGCFGAVISLVQAPVWAAMGIGFSLVGDHVSLLLMGRAKGSWEDTVRAVSYANAGHVLLWIPCLGWLLAMFAVPTLEVIGLRETHGVSTGVALAAVLLWRLVLLAALIAVYVWIFASFFEAAMSV